MHPPEGFSAPADGGDGGGSIQHAPGVGGAGAKRGKSALCVQDPVDRAGGHGGDPVPALRLDVQPATVEQDTTAYLYLPARSPMVWPPSAK